MMVPFFTAGSRPFQPYIGRLHIAEPDNYSKTGKDHDGAVQFGPEWKKNKNKSNSPYISYSAKKKKATAKYCRAPKINFTMKNVLRFCSLFSKSLLKVHSIDIISLSLFLWSLTIDGPLHYVTNDRPLRYLK